MSSSCAVPKWLLVAALVVSASSYKTKGGQGRDAVYEGALSTFVIPLGPPIFLSVSIGEIEMKSKKGKDEFGYVIVSCITSYIPVSFCEGWIVFESDSAFGEDYIVLSGITDLVALASEQEREVELKRKALYKHGDYVPTFAVTGGVGEYKNAGGSVTFNCDPEDTVTLVNGLPTVLSEEVEDLQEELDNFPIIIDAEAETISGPLGLQLDCRITVHV